MELAELFAGHLSKRKRPPASISAYLTALNHFYAKKALGTPWVGGQMTDLAKGYAIHRQRMAQQAGTPELNGGLRVAVPVSVIKLLLTKSEAYAADRLSLLASSEPEDIAAAGTATLLLCWCATFWSMLLFGFRADTIGGKAGADDLRVLPTKAIHHMVRRIKRKNGAGEGLLKPFVRQIPPPRNPTSVRGRVTTIIETAARLIDAEGKPLMLSLIDKPSEAADKVSKAMRVILPPEETPDIADGTFISSHSWRKTGASALAIFCSLFKVKSWGMWASTSSCEKYVDETYQDPDGFMQSLFDWVVSSSDQAPPEDWNGWSGYEGPQDEADDGITSPHDEDDDDTPANADDA
jgi:hypothetical protein